MPEWSWSSSSLPGRGAIITVSKPDNGWPNHVLLTLNSKEDKVADEKQVERDPKQTNSTYDAEKEIPDPEQVEKDRQQAEKIYGNKDRENPAA